MQQTEALLNHLVGALLKAQRHIQAERFGSLEIDHQLELDRGLDRKLARLGALEDAIGIGRRAPIIIDLVISVRQQAADFSEETERIDGRDTVASNQRWPMEASAVDVGMPTLPPAEELAVAPSDKGPVNFELHFTRGADGKIVTPVTIKGDDGNNFEMSFARDKAGRVGSPVTIRRKA
jgi:hypothetical protein